jgi:hypothetical protein
VGDGDGVVRGPSRILRWTKYMGEMKNSDGALDQENPETRGIRERWTMGMLNDKQTDEVPGTCSGVIPHHG